MAALYFSDSSLTMAAGERGGGKRERTRQVLFPSSPPSSAADLEDWQRAHVQLIGQKHWGWERTALHV